MAIQDVEPQQPGDLSLRRGMEIEGKECGIVVWFLSHSKYRP